MTELELSSAEPEGWREKAEREAHEFRASLPAELVEDWEAYIGDSLESAGMVDEFEQGWTLAAKRHQAEVEKLRAALVKIRDYQLLGVSMAGTINRFVLIARKALE